MFFRRRDDVPCRRWGWRNQLIVALRGTADARGYRQWRAVGRHVRAGERAFYITAPILKRRADDDTGSEREAVVGYRGVPVFGYEQTEGDPLPTDDPEERRWMESL